MSSSWSSVVRVETTAQDTYDREAGLKKRPVLFKPDREFDSDETWMFTDGSGSGWHGLVVLRPGEDVRLVAGEVRMPMKNIGAEMNGLLAALEAIVPGERVVIVADLLWSVYYLLGWYNVKHPALRDQVAAAHALLEARLPASLRYIHIRGHRSDGTAFGRWNHVADRLCALRRSVDRIVPMSAFEASGKPAPSLAMILADTPAGDVRG